MIEYETCRRHPRSLSQAFADERATWWEGPQRNPGEHPAVKLMLVVSIIAILLAVAWGVPAL